MLTLVVGPLASPAAAANDYPYASASPNGASQWGFYYRQCTDFVAWRMNHNNGIGFTNNMNGGHWGNAYEWDNNAVRLGYAVNAAPALGAIAQWNEGESGPGFAAGGFGHVAWVAGVAADGSVTIEDYNGTGGNLSYGVRSGVRAPRYLHVKDLGGSGVGEGSFVGTPDGYVYRIAGGAPVYVSNWAAVGGPQPVTAVANLAAFRAYPSDGTFVSAGGFIFRFAGGAPVYVSDWAAVGGSHPSVAVDIAALENADLGVPWNHVHKYPADGTFVGAGPYVFVFAGGAPLYVSNWAAVGGARPVTVVDLAALENADLGMPWNHVHKYPANGTFVGAGGYVYVFAGGAPLYVSTWDAVGGPRPATNVDIAALENADLATPWNHVHRYPADGTLINSLAGTVYRVAGGAPIPLTDWKLLGGQQPFTMVDDAAIQSASGPVPWNHIRKYPADGTLLLGIQSGTSYRVTAGVAVPLATKQGGVPVDQVAIANAGGTGAWSHLLKGGSGFHAVTPVRILDSRTNIGGWAGAKLVAGTPREFSVAGQSGVPASASAVVMNVTVAGGTTNSFVTAYPAGSAKPNASNVNFGAGQIIANLATVKLGSGGRVALATEGGAVEVIADLVGYYDDGTVPGDQFNGITPTRLLDSRDGTGGWNAKLRSGAPRDLVVRQPGNNAGVPASATAVIANVTVTGSTAGSFVSVWPSGVAQPDVSNLNFGPGQTIPNLVVVKIGANGSIRLANAKGDVDVIVDVVGYFDPSTGSRFHATSPTRILDNRYGIGLVGRWGPGQTRAVAVAGAPGTTVPSGATGLIINVTATGGTAASFITVFPDGVARPNSSNLNFAAGETIPNLVTVKIGANGRIDLFNQLGSVDVVADAVGYYAPT